MLLDKSNFKEEGFIGDEFFQNKEQELEYQCRLVQGVVERKVFNLDVALEAYEVSKENYLKFVARNNAELPVVSKEAFITGEVSLDKEVQENTEIVRKTEVDTKNFTGENGKLSAIEHKTSREKRSSFYK